MQIARPPDGFRIIERPAVTALIVASCEEWPRLAHHWEAIKSRLKFTGHREGCQYRSTACENDLFAFGRHSHN